MTYEEARRDYETLCELTNEDTSDLEDFCGDVCNTEMFWELLESPTKRTAKTMYLNFIREAFRRGFGEKGETPDIMNHEVYEIYKKYH